MHMIFLSLNTGDFGEAEVLLSFPAGNNDF